MTAPTLTHDPAADEAAAWAASGAMFLTGRADGPPLGPPEGFVARLRAFGDILSRASGEIGRRLEVDVLALLGERAALTGLRRGGDVSCGGAARLLPTADGWLAVNLPRPEDVDLLPAWLGVTMPLGSVWSDVAGALAGAAAEPLAQRGQLLGLAVAALPQRPRGVGTGTGPLAGLPVIAPRPGDAPRGTAATPSSPGTGLQGLVVADLSSLWAGPLCGQLLQQAGARVIKVESVHRPDGARRGPAAFFDLLHAGQEAVAVDFHTADGRADLRRLLESVDIVIEGSRPRALEQLGLFAEQILDGPGSAGGPRVWVSITGYGRGPAARDKVAFGDDAAAAGRLVVWDETGPCFCADAVADPCAGVVAAAATLRALGAGGRWLLDISMRDVAAHLAGAAADTPTPQAGDGRTMAPHPAAAPPRPAGGALVVAPPRARVVSGRGPGLGEHTGAVLAQVGLSREKR